MFVSIRIVLRGGPTQACSGVSQNRYAEFLSGELKRASARIVGSGPSIAGASVDVEKVVSCRNAENTDCGALTQGGGVRIICAFGRKSVAEEGIGFCGLRL